ncbi:MAG: Gfo/Idh/MocA family protein [Sediminibacterium sp.]
MQKTKFALIGCGRVAMRHLDMISKLGELVAVCDINESAAKETAEKYHASFYSSIESFVQAKHLTDVVVICTPNGMHAQHAICFLELGFHVLVEKPMALSVTDATRMINAAKKHKRFLFTVLQNRFNVPIVALYKAIHQGRLGKIFSVQVNCFWNRDSIYYKNHSWHGDAALDGGVLFTQFSHFIDLILWYFGSVSAIHVFAHNVNHRYTQLEADEGIVSLRFENGILGSLQFSINTYQQNMEGSLTLIGEKGTVKIGGAYLNNIVYQDIENKIEVEAAMPAPLEMVYQSMLRTLHNGEAYYTSPEESLAVVQLIEQIHAAMQTK